MRNIQLIVIVLIAAISLSSCVSKKKFQETLSMQEKLQMTLTQTQEDLRECEDEKSQLQTQIATTESELKSKTDQMDLLNKQVENLKNTNTNLLDRLSDLSVINKAGAESIKKSLQAINDQSEYIKDLNQSIQRKDSVNLALVMNLKRSLTNINDEDVQVEVKKGVVYISLSDKMLFKSGSAVISSRADEVLAKVAKVINDHSELDVLVEGHTDNVPISTDCLKDNWDLSVHRATAIVRVLQYRHKVDPARLTAGGRSQYISKANNSTAQGRSLNRRTEIIITPKLDQFFELLEAPVEDK
jgi:chemotaxis protein MotB